MLKRTIEKFERANVIELYKNGHSLRDLESIIGSDKRTIRDYLLLKGVELTGTTKVLQIDKERLQESKSGKVFDSEIFDTIDTEEKAYWLGFIYADGYVSEKKFHFGISLQAQDVGHLHKFNRFSKHIYNNVSYHPKVTKDKVYDGYRWEITNRHLFESLIEKGCSPRKSLVLKFPDENIFKSPELIKHFIRGYWDGDGCICFTNKTHIVSVLGTKEFLERLNVYLPHNKYAISCHSKNGNNTYCLQCNNKKAYELLKYLYDDSTIYLDRKYQKFLDFCRLYEESYKS